MVMALDNVSKTEEPSSADADSQLILTECQRDPIFFAREVLGITPTEDQEAILLAVRDHKRVTVRSCNNVGKTLIGAVEVLWFGFCFRPCKIITTATVGRQVKAQVWSEIHKLYHGARYHLGGELKQKEWQLGPDSLAIGFTTDKEDRFQGWHAPHILFVLDEASGLAPAIFDGAEGSMGGGHARMLATGNPLRPEGEFYKTFQTPGWVCLKMSADRHPNIIKGTEVIPGGITAEWVRGRQEAWGVTDPRYVARVLGDFPDSVENTLIPLAWVESAKQREVPEEIDSASLRLGCDVARFGDDRTVMCITDKWAIRHIEAHHGDDEMTTCGRLKLLIEEWEIDEEAVAIDDTGGYGGGVIDRLREQGIGVQGINFARKAFDSEQFANVRAEMYWELRRAIDPNGEGEFAVPHEHAGLCGELVQARYKYTSTAQIRLEEKAEIKKRLGRSPDLADALALCFVPRAPSMRIERL